MSGDLLCIAGFDGYFTRVNESWTRTPGHTTAKLLSGPFIGSCTRRIRGSDADDVRSPDARHAGPGVRDRYRCTDGSLSLVEPDGDAQTHERLVYAVAHDATTRKLLEHQTQETLKTRNDFVSFVTHQLRTPLSGIKWMLELAGDMD